MSAHYKLGLRFFYGTMCYLDFLCHLICGTPNVGGGLSGLRSPDCRLVDYAWFLESVDLPITVSEA